MALGPLELVLIGVIAVVVLFFGPKKIPELARSIGLARKEFFSGTADSTQDEPSQSQDALIDVARKLGISTEGKTRDQISVEIVSRKATAS
jgi:sec-independent protein translocase protein TatA